MDRFGRILGRFIALVGFIFTAFISILIYREFANPPCGIDMNRRGTSYVCEDLRPNSGIEVNGIKQLFNPYTDPEIIALSNNNPNEVSTVVRSLINQRKLDERIDWNSFRSDLSILIFFILVFLFGIPIGKGIANSLRKFFS